MTFSGATSFNFTQEMEPLYTAVPEPRTFGQAAGLALVALPLASCYWRRHAPWQQA
jgi:hypothetical protein